MAHLGSSNVALISSSRCVARTGLRRLGYNGLDALKAGRSRPGGLTKVRSSDPACRLADNHTPLGFLLDSQFLWLQVPYGVSPGENT